MSRAEFFNFPNHPILGGDPNSATRGAQTNQLNGNLGYADPTSANFGRITTKFGQRDIQLSLRFMF